jgi:hypothetical protein
MGFPATPCLASQGQFLFHRSSRCIFELGDRTAGSFSGTLALIFFLHIAHYLEHAASDRVPRQDTRDISYVRVAYLLNMVATALRSREPMSVNTQVRMTYCPGGLTTCLTGNGVAEVDGDSCVECLHGGWF